MKNKPMRKSLRKTTPEVKIIYTTTDLSHHSGDAFAPSDEEILRQISHPVTGTRQSQRRLERSHQRRQPKRGPGSQRT